MHFRLNYREDRATQAAARLLRNAGGRLPYMKLLKLLYLVDRRALGEMGRPITFDRYVSMPHGPVLSRTYDVMCTEPDPNRTSYWSSLIERESYDLRLRSPSVPNDQLSPAEESVIDAIWSEFGHYEKWALVEYTHTLPEWEDPRGSSVPIRVRDILLAQGLRPEDADAVLESLSAAADFEAHLGV